MNKPRDKKAVRKATALEKTTPPPAPDKDHNSGRPLPSVNELCHIALALRGSDAEGKPMEAVKAALGLWLTAEYELRRASERHLGANVMAYCPNLQGNLYADFIADREREDRARDPDNRPVAFGSSDSDSEAMKWLETNAKDSEDTFKRFASFESAWTETFAEQAAASRKHCDVGILKLFLKSREAKRLAADRRRKRTKHLEKKLQTSKDRAAAAERSAAEIEAHTAEFLELAKKKDPASKRRLKEVMEKRSTRNVPGKKSDLPGSNG
jgi:hypothetical protein